MWTGAALGLSINMNGIASVNWGVRSGHGISELWRSDDLSFRLILDQYYCVLYCPMFTAH